MRAPGVSGLLIIWLGACATLCLWLAVALVAPLCVCIIRSYTVFCCLFRLCYFPLFCEGFPAVFPALLSYVLFP